MQELKAKFKENLEGIFKDHEARTDEEILDFYCDVAVIIAQDYAKAKDDRIKEIGTLILKGMEEHSNQKIDKVLELLNSDGHYVEDDELWNKILELKK